MSTDELIIKDSEFIKAGKKFKTYFDTLKKVIHQYEIALNHISADAIPSGATHDALVEFNKYVKKLELITEGTGDKFNSLNNSFISDIEKADDYLYDAGISSNLVRDFSTEEYERLVDCLDDPWCSITDSFGDLIYEKINKIIDFFNWDSVKSFLQKCHILLLDYNDETKQGLKNLFDSVQSIDWRYGRSVAGATTFDGDSYTCYFALICLTMYQIRDLLDTMSEIINPQNGMFTVDNINGRLGAAYKNLMSYYRQTMAIKENGERPTINEISDFVSQTWASLYFSCFFRPISDFIADMGGLEQFKMTVFKMFEIVKDKLVSFGNYEEYIAKKQLMSTLKDMMDNYDYSKSDEKKAIDDCKTFMEYVKKYGDEWYKYMNTTRGKNGKLLLDGRTKEAKEFNELLKGLGGAEKILKYGSKGIDYISRLFADYDEGLKILDSFERNYSGDETMKNVISQIRELYNKEYHAWGMELLNEAEEIGIDVALKKLGKMIPVVAVVNKINEGIDSFGEFTGIGTEAKSMYDALCYYQLYSSSETAYYNAIDALKAADPDSDEYKNLARDLENCFNLHKKNTIEMFKAMEKATSDATKKSYYHYCAKQAETLSMNDKTRPDILSYDEFLSLAA